MINIEENYSVPSLKANVVWNTAGSLIYWGTQWLITVLLFRMMGAYETGVFQLCMTIAAVFVSVALFGMRNYQISDVEDRYHNSEYIGSRIITVIITFIVSVAFVMVNSYDTHKKICIILYMIFKLSEAVVDVYHGIDQKLMKMDYVGISFALRGILSFATFVFLCRFTDDLIVSIIGMIVVVYAVIIFYDIPMCSKLMPVKPSFDMKRILPLLFVCIPLVGYNFFMNGNVSVAKYILAKKLGSDLFGYYTSVATPAVIVQTAATFIYSPFVPVLSKYYSERSYKKYIKMILSVCMIIAVICILAVTGSAFLGEYALTMILGDNIADYIYLLVPIIISTCVIAFSWFISTVLIVIRKLKILLFITMSGFAVCAVLTQPLIRIHGANGATYAVIASQLIMIVGYVAVICFDLKRQGKAG